MMEWTGVLARVGVELERHLDSVRDEVTARLGGGRDPIQVVPYLGYGTPERVTVRGRVIEEERIAAADAAHSRWANLLASIRRLESDEIPGAQVRVRLADREAVATADDEGYIHAVLEPQPPLDVRGFLHPVELEVVAPVRQGHEGARARGAVVVPDPSTDFGVISDIDDTVLRTDATSVVRMVRATLFGNARTRLPFPGVAAFYSALHRGGEEQGTAPRRPIFYVSSSPWNLYPFLVEFLDVQQIPLGPLFLRDLGLDPRTTYPTKHAAHKLGAIEELFAAYPWMRFVLIGDSGQEDPEIYREVVARHPDRVLAVYIRNVTPDPERPRAIAALGREVEAAGSTLLLVPDTAAAARHAAERGWIPPERLEAVSAACEAEAPETDEAPE
jgi:phosphatidate phosphatase APP1